MSHELSVVPCASQKMLMESLGFIFDPETYDYPNVKWRGHGLTVELKETDPAEPAVIIKRIVDAAKDAARDEISQGVKKLFRL